MMTVDTLVAKLRRLDVQLWLDGDHLRYKAPQKVLTPELLKDLATHKPDLVGFLQKIQTDSGPSRTHPIPRRPDVDLVPLSFSQQRLFFLNQLEPESSAYHIHTTFRLEGIFNIEAFQQAIATIVERHESLRTNFVMTDGVPFQVITPPRKSSALSLIDCSDVPKSDQAAKVHNLLSDGVNRPFNLSSDVMLRVTLIDLGNHEYVLQVVMHHIASDGWSLGVFFRELSMLYGAFSRGEASPLSELAIQYADFADWQRQQSLHSEDFQAKLHYWKQQLGDSTHVLELPTDYSRPAVQTYQGASLGQHLPKRLKVQLQQLGCQEEATLFMMLLTAFKLLCYRFTNQEKITIGSPIAGRNRAELEQLIGFFVSNLVLHTDLSGNPSCRELLRRVRQVALEAYTNQDIPFEKLLEELQPERDLSRTPLFQVWFNMLNLNEQRFNLLGLKVEPFSAVPLASKFDLTLYAGETEQGISIEWVYNSHLFDESTIKQMSSCFQTLLNNMAAYPDAKISTISLFKRQDYSRQLSSARFNPLSASPANSFSLDIESSISSCFEAQARQYADHIAIKTKHYEWTYQELNAQANKIARVVRRVQSGQAERIALLFAHEAPMIASILGTLKAGKSYIPLDPQFPVERLRYILQDAQATTILVNSQTLERVQPLADGAIEIINVDELENVDSSTSVGDQGTTVSPDAIAYILYTSGSTGRPKGVSQNHRNVLHFIRNQTHQLQIHSQDRLTLLPSYSSDAAVVDIFSALLNGATLYPFDIKVDGVVGLSRWLVEHQITIYHSTPTLYRHFLAQLPAKVGQAVAQFPTIRAVVLGGEECLPQDVALYKQAFAPECLFVNLYGSTESTVSLQHVLSHQTDMTLRFIPIGYPISDTEILLLDESGTETEIYGEIAIRSRHLGLGYWGKPELTQAVFLPDPDEGDRRIYRTGDMGRLRANGTIEFLGRKDFQIKLRGFRIELHEVEAALRQHPQVQKAVVIGREDVPGDKYLAAYVVPQPGQTPTTSDLRRTMLRSLPEYMTPSSFVFLEAIPLTPNGKINRRDLPAPDSEQRRGESEFIAPRTCVEGELCRIWRDLLKLEQVSTADNFFDLGGHSLLALRLFTEIEKTFGCNLPLVTLFQAPTIEALATLLRDSSGAVPADCSLIALQPNGRKPPLFLAPPAGSTVLSFGRLVRHLKPDQPVYGLEPLGMDGKQFPHIRVEDMATYYIEEIQKFQPQGPYYLAGRCFGGIVAFEMAQQLLEKGQTVAMLALLDTETPPNYSRGDLNAKVVVPRPRKYLGYYLARIASGHYLQRLTNSLKRGRLTYPRVKEKLARFLTAKISAICLSILDRAEHKDSTMMVLQERLFAKCPKLLTLAAHRKARQDYLGKVYPGKIIFLENSHPEGHLKKRWAELTAGGLERHIVAGNHRSMITEPENAKDVAKHLSICLETARSEIANMNKC